MTETVKAPGTILTEEFLKPNGITQQELGEAMHLSPTVVNAICRGKRTITPKTAVMLGKALGTSPEYWLGLQAKWDIAHIEDDVDADAIVTESNDGIYESGGWFFSSLEHDDSRLGKAVKAALDAAGEINDTDGYVRDSIANYVGRRTIEVPGTQKYLERRDDIPWPAVAIFKQFLINVGENRTEVDNLFYNERVRLVHEVGSTDIDGCSRPTNWRQAKKVNLDYIGELMCAAWHLSQEDCNDVMDSLFHYTHDELVIMPDSVDAKRVFNRFLVHCEGYHGASEALGMTAEEYFGQEWVH